MVEVRLTIIEPYFAKMGLEPSDFFYELQVPNSIQRTHMAYIGGYCGVGFIVEICPYRQLNENQIFKAKSLADGLGLRRAVVSDGVIIQFYQKSNNLWNMEIEIDIVKQNLYSEILNSFVNFH